MQTSDLEHNSPAAVPELTTLKGDLIKGVKQISEFLGFSERQTFHLCSTGQLSGAFKLGRNWHARKSTLIEGLRRREKGNI